MQDKTVSAKELWKTLGIQTAYNDWIKRQVVYFSLSELDYSIAKVPTKGRPSIDYILSEKAKNLIVQRHRLGACIAAKNRNETRFFKSLERILKQIQPLRHFKIHLQYRVGLYRADGCIPTCKLVIEYNEAYHEGVTQQNKDQKRRLDIKEFGFSIITISEKEEAKGVGEVIDFLLNSLTFSHD